MLYRQFDDVISVEHRHFFCRTALHPIAFNESVSKLQRRFEGRRLETGFGRARE